MGVQLVVFAVIAVYVLLAIIGLTGNVWVMWTVLSQLIGCFTGSHPHKPPVQSSAFIYLLLLSIVDTVSFLPTPLLVSDLLLSRFVFSLPICKFLLICEGFNKTLSPMVLTALSIDRYIAVCQPTLTWMRQTTFSLFVVFGCFLFSTSFIVFIGIGAEISEMPLTPFIKVPKCSLMPQTWFVIAQVIVCYMMPLVLICSVYAAILSKLYRHTRVSSVGRRTSISLSRVVKCSVLVVAFYFLCWTPYFLMQFGHAFAELAYPERHLENEDIVLSPENTSTVDIVETATLDSANISIDLYTEIYGPGTDMDQNLQIFLFYMLHALPYTQSAFNWLFYAFLNRNLRNVSHRANGVRSTASTLIVDANSTGSGNGAPLWRNIQQMGSQLKAAGIDTGNLLLRNSPFRNRSKRRFRSSAYLDEKPSLLLVQSVGPERSSMLELPVDRSLSPPRPHSAACALELTPSATSSIEWL